MFLTIALVVLMASIAVFFSKEFASLTKKLTAFPGGKLIIPLILVTFFVEVFEPWVLLALFSLQTNFLSACEKLAAHLPFNAYINLLTVKIILLTACSLLPVAAINWWNKRKPYVAFQSSNLVGVFLWILITILLVVKRVQY